MKKPIFPTDSELITLLKNSDQVAFEMLYRKYKGVIYNFIMKISDGDFYLAEEIVQNIFVKIWDTRMLLTIEGSFSSFLFVMSKNMYVSYLRKQVHESIFHDYYKTQTLDSEYTVEREVNYKLLEEEIERLVGQLPQARQKVYRLSKERHLSNKEIAKSLNISVNTVENHLSKAISYLKSKLSL
ncbi:MAG: RNA polymerase sigma factor [Bacteroidales bacterium]